MLKKLKHINRPKAFNDDSILPLINIVFLLLIFFIVIGSFYPTEIKKTDLSRVSATAKLNSKNIVIRITDTGEVLQKGKVINWDTIKFKKTDKITISVDKNAKAIVMVKILKKLKRRGLTSVEVAVKPKVGSD
ncbi:MAG: ExbD/TolR family protein [Alphaproteobacteria bacterium]